MSAVDGSMFTSNPNDVAGFFDPGSGIWRVNREMVLLMAGGRALLMQLAHPKVAAGVADHSRFQKDPFTRLRRTMSVMWSIVFDPQPQARASLERVELRHKNVRGVVPGGELAQSGAPYDAFEQDLLLWVHATLIDSALAAYSRFVAPLAQGEKEAYYNDAKKLAMLFGIRREIIPASLKTFQAYMDRALFGGEIAVGPTAKSLARDVLYPQSLVFKPGEPLFRFITVGLLPESLRAAYGLRWSARSEKALGLLASAIRGLLPLMPRPIRIVPNARKSEKARRWPAAHS